MVFDLLFMYLLIVCVFDGNLRNGDTQILDFHKSAFLGTLFLFSEMQKVQLYQLPMFAM
jgi:hypothetical protein